MKRLLLLLALIPCSLSLLAQPASLMGRQDSGYTNKEEATNQMLAGLKQGKWIEYKDKAFNPTTDINAPFYTLKIYRDGTPVGKVRIYAKNGKLRSEMFFAHGVMNGSAKEYDDNGRLKIVLPYIDGKITGTGKTYFDNGVLASETPVIDGKGNGLQKIYYPNGKIHFEVNYTDDKKNGTEKEYYESGILKAFNIYNKGVLGQAKNYDVNGKEIIK